MADTLRLEIVTPEGRSFSDDVNSVVLPGVEGEFGVLPDHMPMVTQIHPGELVIQKGDQEFRLAVGEGFVELTGDHVSVLTDMAQDASHIDEAKAEEARQRAEKALQEKHTAEEIAAATASLERAVAQLRVKRRRQS